MNYRGPYISYSDNDFIPPLNPDSPDSYRGEGVRGISDRVLVIMIIILFPVLSGCKVKYSFTGASISPDVKTISIHYFPNNSSQGPGNLGNLFTEDLKNKFTAQTNLRMSESGGDLDVEGYISSYGALPVGIQGGENVALNRLTIAVYLKFTNRLDEKQNFETSFTRYADYDSKLNLTSIEDDLIKQINAQLVDDIYNRAVADW
ncbi:MAG: hypothetical protein HYY40_00225 [Bacteroidetes bacterium]|nr:hypothetical protein [Bacteroidota bacterium]